MCMPPKATKFPPKRVNLRSRPVILRAARFYRNEETGLVRQFFDRPRRGKWVFAGVRYAD